MEEESLFYDKLNKFLTFDNCDFSPSLCTKGTFLHIEFCSFLSREGVSSIPGIKLFYDLIRTWIIKQKDIKQQIKEHLYSKTIYFLGIEVKGKPDNSKLIHDKIERQRKKEYRHKKAENEGREIKERRSKPKLNKLYVTELPKDVSEWSQYRITIENFESWYHWFINEFRSNDSEEIYLILNQALNNFRHAKELRPREFNNNNFKFLLRHAEDALVSYEEKIEDNVR